MFSNTRRRSFRNLTPTVDGLEGRQMLTSLSFAATVATPLEIKKMAPIAEVQKVRDAAIQGNHIGTNAESVGGHHSGGGMVVTNDLNPQPLPPGEHEPIKII